MAFTRDWEESIPEGTEDASLGDNRIRNLKVELGERLEDLLCGFNISDGTGDESTAGVKKLNFKEQSSISTPSANQITLAAKESEDSKAELFWKDEDGDERQITEGGQLLLGKSTTPYPLMHNTTEEDTDGGRESRLTAKGEQSGGEITTLGYIEFSHEGSSDDEKGQCTIVVNDGDDGNAPSKKAIRFTSDGKISVANSISVLDEDDMSANSAVQVATQQSIKAHIATQIAAVAGHDGDGYAYFDIDDSKTKVYTKYLTGTTDADAQTSVAHGVTGSRILHVSVAILQSGSTYWSDSWKNSVDSNYAVTLKYDGTNIIIDHGSQFQNSGYRIKIDYY